MAVFFNNVKLGANGMPVTSSATITFIVPVKQREHNIAGFVQSVAKFNPHIIFVSQVDNKPFNKGALYNLGFAHSTSDLVIFADVDIRFPDMINFVDLMNQINKPFVPFDRIRDIKEGKVINTCFRLTAWGGCAVFTRKQFTDCGGFTNRIEDWGLEDELMQRRSGMVRVPGILEHINHERKHFESLNSGQLDKNRLVLNHDNPKDDNYSTVKGTLVFQYKEPNITWLSYTDLGNNINLNITNKSTKPKLGVIYTTFYDLELIEDSIKNIRNAVDYIVMVHQKIGFNGNPEPDGNAKIITHLISEKLVDNIIYFTGGVRTTGMMDKLNVGLDDLRKHNCKYAIQLAPDMTYNSDELMFEINEMERLNIDTLYVPIKTFYYDHFHYFIDTYYLQGIHRINDRKYERCKSTYLCDPQAKMQEGNFKLSKYSVLHYSFLKDFYANKLQNSIRAGNASVKADMIRVYDHLINWQEGQPALVFQNDMTKGGEVYCGKVSLNREYNKQVSVNIATYQKRKQALISCLNHIVNYPIIDVIRVYLNNYKNINGLPISDKIQYTIGKTNFKDSGKFFWQNDTDEFYFTLDDDLLYDEIFFINSIKTLLAFNCVPFVSIHGKIYKESSSLFNDFFKSYHCRKHKKGNSWVNNLGTGVMVHDSGLYKIDMSLFKYHGMADLWIAKYCNEYSIPMLCREHSDSELSMIDLQGEKTLWDVRASFTEQHKEILQSCKWNVNTIRNLSVIIPTMWRSKYLLDMLSVYDNNPLIKEVIIIDNDITKTFDISSFKKVKHLPQSENIFVNPAWNLGVKTSVSEFIMITNDDILISNEDLNSIIKSGLLLKDNEMIGINKHCYKQKGLRATGFKLQKCNKMGYGFGTLMIMKKHSFVEIPDDLKIWCGDDIQFNNNTAYEVCGIEITTPMSTTVNSFRQTICAQDVINWAKYNNNGTLKQM